MNTMRTTLTLFIVACTCLFGTAYNLNSTYSNPSIDEVVKGPCDCEKGWNFIVHQITPEGCRQKSIYCSEGVELEPGYSCGTCPKPCSTCEEDEEGMITICRVFNKNRASQFKAECGDLQDYFKDNGDFKNRNDHCGPCTCADVGDQDSDGDGICDKKDECPEDPNKSEVGECGCHETDSDDDGVCDELDECPEDPDKQLEDACGCFEVDSDRDGVCDQLDECPEDPNKSVDDACGCNEMDSDNDGVCDQLDECPDNPDKSSKGKCDCDDEDVDQDGICDSEDDFIGKDVCDISGNNWYEWIESIVINGYTNKSGSNSNGYGNYTNQKISVGKGDVLSIWINTGHADDVCEMSFAIFADWNHDGDFMDNGEVLLNERGSGERGIDYQLPEDIAEGSYIIRIVTDLGRIYGACGGCVDGETEDYLIEIVESSCSSVYEGFDYPVDQPILGKEGGKNWGSPWSVTSEGSAYADVLSGSISNTGFSSIGNKLGILNKPDSKITISRDLETPVFQKNGEVWLSFVYVRDGNTVFDPQINGKSIGAYVNKDGYLVIGGLKGVKLEQKTPYIFLIGARLNQGTDEVDISVILSSERSSIFSQTYNIDLASRLSSIAFEFKSDDSNTDYTAQYFDEINIGCTRDEVLNYDESDDDLDGASSTSYSVAVYPNPIEVGQQFVVSLKGSDVLINDYVIYDAAGQLMVSGTLLNGDNQMSLGRLQSGIYFIEINTTIGVIRERIVIQNG